MEANPVSIVSYANEYHTEVLRLLLELQCKHFEQSAPKQLQELKKEVDIKKSYSDYLALIEQDKNGMWQIYLAITNTNKPIGFIIGSIEKDEYQVLDTIGNFEDWYVEPQYRGEGIGQKLYDQLESWFKEKGCQQVQSDTWQGNDISKKAHQKAGFFISGIQFRKKL